PGPTIRQVVPDSFLQESLFVSIRSCFSNNWWLKTTEYKVQGTTLHQNTIGAEMRTWTTWRTAPNTWRTTTTLFLVRGCAPDLPFVRLYLIAFCKKASL
ncbi:MAG: hypothetical protein ACRCX4_08655, partial [Bacteroidales bacterium]